MSGEDIARLVEAMVAGGGSRAETFFISQDLGAAYDAVSKNYGIQKHVNAALHQARREGRQDDVVRAGLAAYDLEEVDGDGREQNVAPSKPSPTSRLFISHASADKKLAEALTDLLQLGTGLPDDRILCTSLEGLGIPVGTTDYLEFLRGHISAADLVLPLFTPAFFDSEVCLIEIGAMWGLKQPAFPLIVPPVDFARVEKLLGKVQAARIDTETGLSELHDQIVKRFGLSANTPKWNAKRTAFEGKLPGLLHDLAKGTRVPAADLKAARKRANKHRTRVERLEAEVEALQERLVAVTEAKNKEMLEEALEPEGSDIERFQAHVDEARGALRPLSAGVREALYEHLGQNQVFRPDFRFDDDAEVALRDDLLYYDENQNGYSPNTDDPAIEDAIGAVTNLFESDWDEDLHDWFRRTYRKRFDVDVRAVWVALGLL